MIFKISVLAHQQSLLRLTVTTSMYYFQASLVHELTIVALSVMLLWALWKAVLHFVLPSPLDMLRGPPSTSWLSGEPPNAMILLKKDAHEGQPGHMRDIYNRHAWGFLDSLATDYAPVSAIRGWAGVSALLRQM